MRENGPLLSRVVDPPGTKGGPRAGNFPGPPKNTFCPGCSHHPGQKDLLSRVVASPGTKAPPIYFLPPSFALPPNTCFFWCRRRPLLPPPREPTSPSTAAVDVAAQSPAARAQRHRAPSSLRAPPPLTPPSRPRPRATSARRPGLHSARTPSSSPPPAASTARRRAATLSAARHRAASSPPRRPGPCRAPRFPRRPV